MRRSFIVLWLVIRRVRSTIIPQLNAAFDNYNYSLYFFRQSAECFTQRPSTGLGMLSVFPLYVSTVVIYLLPYFILLYFVQAYIYERRSIRSRTSLIQRQWIEHFWQLCNFSTCFPCSSLQYSHCSTSRLEPVALSFSLAPVEISGQNAVKHFHRFYARKQNASRVFAIVWASVRPSVRPSVCLSVTIVSCIKTVQARICLLYTSPSPRD